MALILDLNVDRTMTLDEYVDYVETHVDVYDLDSITEHAWALRALANDRKFLLDGYHDQLKSYLTDFRPGRVLPQSIVPARRKNFYLRANIWIPLTEETDENGFERSLYSYEMAHDHNYNLVTVGYYGPGYETEIYEYDYDAVSGYEGEQVALTYTGRYQLHPGRVMIYRASKDIHIQLPPKQVSVSLNLMCTPNQWHAPQQYIFDVEQRTIIRGAGDIVSMRLFLLDIMRQVHDDNTVEILEDFVANHRCARTQAYALTVLEQICPGDLERFRSRASPAALRLSGLALVNGSGVRDQDA